MMRAFRNAERIGVSMAVGLALCASAAAQPAPRCTMEGLVQAVEGARQNMGQQSGEFRIGIRTH